MVGIVDSRLVGDPTFVGEGKGDENGDEKGEKDGWLDDPGLWVEVGLARLAGLPHRLLPSSGTSSNSCAQKVHTRAME
jgi:hypothetical protein